eukprot:SAG31_NODE_5830_length_2304_cov_2.628571_2_plen_118_part_00
MQSRAQSLDGDGDGLISREEAVAGSSASVIESGIGPGMTMYGNSANFDAADIEPTDGKLSKNEVERHHREKVTADVLMLWAAHDIMRAADADHDNFLTHDEYAARTAVFRHHLHDET